MDLKLTSSVAVVMAASKGLGAATARVFAEEGARVVISARNLDALTATAASIRNDTGAQIVPVKADSAIAGDINMLIATAMDHFGRIDALIVNAGGPPPGKFVDTSDETWASAVDLTLMSAVRAARAVIPVMQAQGGGSITFITSVGIKHALDNLLLSNSLRLAVVGLAKTMSRELGTYGIRVNTVCPGYTATDRLISLNQATAARNNTTLEQELAKLGGNVPLGRVASPEEFGRACVFLASPAASYITGAALMVDGGMSRVM
jgi:3-oxoacyl-[acyl-carrier protein] reductase